MLIAAPQLYSPQVKMKKRAVPSGTGQNFVNKGLTQDTVSFSGQINKYLNKNIAQQSMVFKQELLSLLMSDKPVAENLKHLTNCVFKDLKFEIRDIKEVKHPDIIANPPIIFRKTNFSQSTPKTYFFINFDKINKIRNGAVNPQEHFAKYTQEISESVSRSNELNLISNMSDEFAQKFSELPVIDKSSTDKLIGELFSKHNLDIDYKVADRKDFPNAVGTHCHIETTDKYGDKKHIFAIDFEGPKDDLVFAIPHELIHAINRNSIEFNEITALRNKMHNPSQLDIDYANGVAEICKSDRNFIYLPTKIRKEKYDELLNNLIKNSPEDKKAIIEMLEVHTKDEAFAYSKTPGLAKFYEENPRQIKYGLIFKDFHNYILSIRYDSSKLNALGN